MLTVALTQTSAKRVLLWNVMVRLAYDVTQWRAQEFLTGGAKKMISPD